MSIIKWKEEYSVGITEIDNQHKKLIIMIGKISGSIGSNDIKETAGSIIKELAEYTVYHFGTEETYFKKFEYENSKAHIEIHKIFIDKVVGVQKKLKELEGGDEAEFMEFMYEILDFLQDWLINHIMHEDKKYTKCFNNNGLF